MSHCVAALYQRMHSFCSRAFQANAFETCWHCTKMSTFCTGLPGSDFEGCLLLSYAVCCCLLCLLFHANFLVAAHWRQAKEMSCRNCSMHACRRVNNACSQAVTPSWFVADGMNFDRTKQVKEYVVPCCKPAGHVVNEIVTEQTLCIARTFVTSYKGLRKTQTLRVAHAVGPQIRIQRHHHSATTFCHCARSACTAPPPNATWAAPRVGTLFLAALTVLPCPHLPPGHCRWLPTLVPTGHDRRRRLLPPAGPSAAAACRALSLTCRPLPPCSEPLPWRA